MSDMARESEFFHAARDVYGEFLSGRMNKPNAVYSFEGFKR